MRPIVLLPTPMGPIRKTLLFVAMVNRLSTPPGALAHSGRNLTRLSPAPRSQAACSGLEHHLGSDKNQSLRAVRCADLAPEQDAKQRYLTQQRSGGFAANRLLPKAATQHQGFAITD